MEYVSIGYAGVAALLSAIGGISASFIGNRLFVFRSRATIGMELIRLKTVYAGIVLFQAVCMGLWVDLLSLNYSLGFILITAISVFLSYLGNWTFVFI